MKRGIMADKKPDGTNTRIDREILRTVRNDNQKVMREYDQEAITQELKEETRRNQLFVLRRLSDFVDKPFKKMTKEDIRKFLVEIKTFDGRRYSKSILKTFRINVKKFFRWLEGDEDTIPAKVKWIKPGPKDKNGISADMLLNEKEIKKMIEACTTSRDRAIMSVLYESGARASEFLNLKIGDISPDKFGARITVNGKTGRRPIRLINSWPYLATYLEDHPEKDNPKAGLWIAFTNNQHSKEAKDRFKVNTLRELINKVVENAGIKKDVWPHLLRHSRLTQLAIEGYNEMDLRMFAGWSDDSRMPSVYLHLTHKDLDDKMLKRHGFKDVEEQEESVLKPKECPRCFAQNPATNKYCGRCRMPLEFETAMDELDREFEMVMEDPEIVAMVKRKLREISSS